MLPNFKGTETHENLEEAFGGEIHSQSRYLYFAKQADIEGILILPDYSGILPKVRPAILSANGLS